MNQPHITGLTTYEFKKGEFRREHAGKLNFYLSVVDDKVRHPNDQSASACLSARIKTR
ncbi:MAG: hypothetical protein ABIN89_06360 [Chitinophagaceae bacterium]